MAAMKGAHLAVLLVLAGLLFLVGLGSLGLTDRDEGSNAEAAREMVESGNWISPTLNGEPRFAKPVFLYWLIGGAYLLFGVSEVSARLPSAVFGILLILLQYAFLSRVRGVAVGLFGALMLLLNFEMVAIGRLVLTDSVLIFFTTLAVYGFWIGLHGEGRERWFMGLFYLGMALGTLTKGPIGVLVPLLATVPYLTLTRRWGQFRRRGFPIEGLALFVVVALPWYAAMLSIHGTRYTDSAQRDTVGRFFSVIGGHGGTVLLYVPVLLFGFFPWSGFLLVALYQALKGWREARRSEPGPSRSQAPQELELFSALWVVAVFVFFSASASRLPHYIGPLFPAAAILTASYWSRCLEDPRTPGVRGAFRTTMVLGCLLGIAMAAVPELYRRFVDKIAKEFPFAHQVDPGLGPIAAGGFLIIGMAAVGYFGLSEKRRPGAFWAAGAVIALLILGGVQIALPRFSRLFIAPPQELARAAGMSLAPEDRLILYGPFKPSYIFYARRKVILIKAGDEPQMLPHLAQSGRTMILLPARLRWRLPGEAISYRVVLERDGYVLLANRPIIDIPGRPPESPARQSLGPAGRPGSHSPGEQQHPSHSVEG